MTGVTHHLDHYTHLTCSPRESKMVLRAALVSKEAYGWQLLQL